MTFDWIASLSFVAMVIAATLLGRKLAFSVPDLQRMRQFNRDQDRLKRAMHKYPPVIRSNNQIGLIFNLVFFITVAPFFVTLNAQPQ